MVVMSEARTCRADKRRSLLLRKSLMGAITFLESPIDTPGSSEELYRLIGKVERDIAGDAGVIGMSGSVSRPDMARILKAMKVDEESNFLDVGSGLGRPMLHALNAGAKSVSGVEFDLVKHQKCQTVISRILPITEQTRTCCLHRDVLTMSDLEEVQTDLTHIYSFWEGINFDARQAVGRLIAQSWQKYGRISSVAFVQAHRDNLDAYTRNLGFPPELQFVETFPVSMMGSAAKFKAYIFRLPQVQVKPVLSTICINTCEIKAVQIKKSHRKRQRQGDVPIADADEVMLGNYMVAKRKTRSRAQNVPTAQAAIDIVPVEEQPPDNDLIALTYMASRGHSDNSQDISKPIKAGVDLTTSSDNAQDVATQMLKSIVLPVSLAVAANEMALGDYVLERRATRTCRKTLSVQ